MPLYTVNTTDRPGGLITTTQVVAEDPAEARKAVVKKREEAGDPEPLMTSIWRDY